MKMQTLGLKPQQLRKLVKSTETSTTIKKGAPCVLSNSSGSYGYGVKSVESLAAAEQNFFFGIAVADIPAKGVGETVFGYVENVRVIMRTRAASTDVWASTAALSLGAILVMNTGASVQAFSQSAIGSALVNAAPAFVAIDTAASDTTLASSLGSSSISSIVLKRAFVAIM